MSRLWLCLLVAAGAAACTGSANVGEAVQLQDVTTGWFDAGIVEGGLNKIVPSVSIRLKNVGQTSLSSVQLNAVFRQVGQPEEWGSAYVKALRQPLAPGAISEPIVLRSGLGYTGTEPRAQMLQNRHFVDATVEIFGRHRSAQWTKLGEFRIKRQLLTH